MSRFQRGIRCPGVGANRYAEAARRGWFPHALVGMWFLGVAGCASTGEGGGVEDDKSAEPLYESLSGRDVALADGVLQTALESAVSGQPMTWDNPNTGNSGIVVPIRTYRIESSGIYCREYKEILRVSGHEVVYRDTACRTGEGVWKLVDA